MKLSDQFFKAEKLIENIHNLEIKIANTREKNFIKLLSTVKQSIKDNKMNDEISDMYVSKFMSFLTKVYKTLQEDYDDLLLEIEEGLEN